jgi:hypothetical protein
MSRRKEVVSNEIFLSHASADRVFANRIAELLRRHGLSVWYSRTNLIGAGQWHDEIGEGLAQCNYFCVLLSPAAVRSKWVKRELLYALKSRRYGDRIVPILYKPCDLARLSWTLSAFQTVDFTRGFEVGSVDLLRIWGSRPASDQ